MAEASQKFRALWERSGLTQKALAKAMGYNDASGLQRYLAPEHPAKYFDRELIEKAADALAGLGEPPITNEEVYEIAGFSPPSDIGLSEANAGIRRQLPLIPSGRDFPVYGTAMGGSDGSFELNGQVVDLVRRPPALAGSKTAFAIYVEGDSMSPRYEPGELAFIHPDRPLVVGREVLIELLPEDGGRGEGRCYIKRLVRRTADKVIVEQFNPRKQIAFPLKRIKRMHRVLSAGELLEI